MDSLHGFLQAETIARLEELAETIRPARAYLTLLEASAVMLEHAQRLENTSTSEIDQMCMETTHTITSAFPEGINSVHSALENLSGYTDENYFQRRAHVASAKKTPLLLHLGQLVARARQQRRPYRLI